MSPVGSPRHPDDEVLEAVLLQTSSPARLQAVRVDLLKAMHRMVGVYSENVGASPTPRRKGVRS
jgi:hypothetical protein